MQIRLLFLGLLILALSACAPQSQTDQADSEAPDAASTLTEVKITFRTGERFNFTDPTSLKYCASLISDRSAPLFKCGYDGSITFLEGETVRRTAEFNLRESCRHIVFTEKEQVQSREMSIAGYRFLEGLRPDGVGAPGALSDLNWILGKWRYTEGKGTVSYETWEKRSENAYAGVAYTLNNGDTSFVEQIELVQEGNEIFYIPTVRENQGPVRFRMITHGKTSAVFDNPGHDFPQTISYQVTEDSILHARISGVRILPDGSQEPGFSDFYMNRIR
ncbi:MAG: DUF6265 family protein [Bacteroidota bacterium]